MSWLDPRNIFGMPEIKMEDSPVLDSYRYKATERYVDPFKEHAEALRRIEYVLARTVPNYDELVNQFNAIKDIERSNHE